MTYIHEILDTDLLEWEIRYGWVRKQIHPTQPLAILNYSKATQYHGRWNRVTRLCRGLIYNEANGQVLARPFEKFFNWEELPDPWKGFDLDEPVEVTDKLDGSLGIMYLDDYGNPRIATRGSFRSEQAIRANVILDSQYPDFRPPTGWTLLFEIIYPENRIVVDYGDTEDLILIGAVDIRSGATMGPGWPVDWSGPRAEVLAPKTFREALDEPPRPGKEGIVVRFLYTDERVKLKQADYVELHRIATGLNRKVIWERTMRAWLDLPNDQAKMEAVLAGIPEELYDWARDEATDLVNAFYDLVSDVTEAWSTVWGHHDTRAEFAAEANTYPKLIRKALFLKHDGMDYDELLWKSLKPKGEDNVRGD